MKNSAPELHTEMIPADYTPTQDQLDALARRLMPEIKKFFANEDVQREFAEWKARQDK